MVVEWSRSCYSSSWLLSRDDPAIRTRGRYYFAPPGTPHYPSLHRLGSRTWYDGNWRHAQSLGEDMAAKHVWNAGQLPADLPRAISVGTPECIADGEYAIEMIPASTLHGGFSPGCMGPDELLHLWKFASSYARCVTQRFYSQLISYLYVRNDADINVTVLLWLGPTVVVRIHAGTAFMPRVITLTAPGWSAAVVDGTDNFQQLALQAFQSIAGPTNLGAFSSLPLWHTASQWILGFLVSDGYVLGSPLMLVGHSYGAAAILNLAARLRAASPTLHIRYLTFGCPKIGDLRMIELLSRCEGYDLADDGDFVTILPPSLPTLDPVVFIVGLPSLLRWTLWLRPPHQVLIRADGVVGLRDETLIDTAVLLFMTEQIILGNPLAAISSHSMATYNYRLALRCKWPTAGTGSVVLGGMAAMPAQVGALVLGGDMPQPEESGGLALNASTWSCPRYGPIIDAVVVPIGTIVSGGTSMPSVGWYKFGPSGDKATTITYCSPDLSHTDQAILARYRTPPFGCDLQIKGFFHGGVVCETLPGPDLDSDEWWIEVSPFAVEWTFSYQIKV